MIKVLLGQCDGCAIPTLKQPQAENAPSRELQNAVARLFPECRDDSAIRVLVMTSAVVA